MAVNVVVPPDVHTTDGLAVAVTVGVGVTDTVTVAGDMAQPGAVDDTV